MTPKTKEKTIKASKFVSFLDKHKNEPINFSIAKNDIQLNIRGEIHKHDEQFWITRGDAKVIVEVKQVGTWFSRLMKWPEKEYHIQVNMTLAGESVASMKIPLRSNEKFPCSIE